MNIVIPEFKKLILILNKHKVNYMLIGGYAVIYYGYDRTTNDLDIWLEPTDANRDKLIKALEEYNIHSDDLKLLSKIDFTKIQYFFIGEKPKKIDFLTKINNVTFDEAIKSVNHFPLENEQVPIIQYHHLILSKISNDRLKDKADVEELQRINKHRNKLD
jgi:hypothetical protein